jgi:indoleamine 2,3-dioxygenase
MKLSTTTTDLLKKYDVDLNYGFLPAIKPLCALPEAYKQWDDINTKMADAIKAGTFVKMVEDLPQLEVGNFNKAELERAMLILGAVAHAYVKVSQLNQIPAQVAVPWVDIATKLQRKPIITHSALVLQNWKLIEKEEGFHVDNLQTQMSFTGTKTESWFFLVTANIEKIGAKAIPLLLESIHLAKSKAYGASIQLLEKVLEIGKDLLAALRKMYEFCDPTIFYNEVRPFFDSFIDVKYLGTNPVTRSYAGGSAAQSSLLQFLDMSVGMDYGNSHSRDFLLEMRHFMPYPHRNFLNFIDHSYNLKEVRKENQALNEISQEIIQFLIAFRNEHLKMVSQYIIRPARANQTSITGTGGTNPLKFLKAIRNKNVENKERS